MRVTKKVKIFTLGVTGENFNELESIVNEWFKANSQNISISSYQASSAIGVNDLQKSFVSCTIVIFYHDI